MDTIIPPEAESDLGQDDGTVGRHGAVRVSDHADAVAVVATETTLPQTKRNPMAFHLVASGYGLDGSRFPRSENVDLRPRRLLG